MIFLQVIQKWSTYFPIRLNLRKIVKFDSHNCPIWAFALAFSETSSADVVGSIFLEIGDTSLHNSNNKIVTVYINDLITIPPQIKQEYI